MMKLKNEADAVVFLNHAAWYCRYGPQVVDREPDAADLAAFNILHRLAGEISRGVRRGAEPSGL
jgi:hypothetical protein